MTVATIARRASAATTASRAEPVDLEADDPGRERVAPAACSSVTCLIAGQPRLQPPRELVDAGRDPRLADALVEAERLRQRPAVLEGVEAAGRHGGAGRCPRREGRDRRRHRAPGVRPAPDEPGAARPEEPLVAARDEEVAAERADGRVLGAERRGRRRRRAGAAPGRGSARRRSAAPAASRRCSSAPRSSRRRASAAPTAPLQRRDDLVRGRRARLGRRAGPGAPRRRSARPSARSASCVA